MPALRELGLRDPAVAAGRVLRLRGLLALTRDSFAFARDLLEEAGVAITPGVDFGSHRAAQHVRFAYTNSIERLAEGVRRIAAFVNAG